ncbi:MAG: flavodoxin family protein [Candidatus Altiarchaeota archaeon]
MRVLGISGGHRPGANTDALVERALSVCESAGLDTEFIALSNRQVGYCTVCDACKKSFTCTVEDDVFPILEKMRDADAIIVGTPTYFASVSGKLKAFMDRTLPLRRNKMMLSGKIGGAIAVGGSRNGGQEKAVSEITDWMLLQEMLVVSDKKTAHFGGIAVARNPGDALADEIGVETVENLAKKIVETLKRTGK